MLWITKWEKHTHFGNLTFMNSTFIQTQSDNTKNILKIFILHWSKIASHWSILATKSPRNFSYFRAKTARLTKCCRHFILILTSVFSRLFNFVLYSQMSWVMTPRTVVGITNLAVKQTWRTWATSAWTATRMVPWCRVMCFTVVRKWWVPKPWKTSGVTSIGQSMAIMKCVKIHWMPPKCSSYTRVHTRVMSMMSPLFRLIWAIIMPTTFRHLLSQ